MLKESQREDDIKMIYEAYFVFAVMWSFGGCLAEDKFSFSNNIRSISKIKFPEGGQVFDYFFDPIQLSWIHW
jgi:dynein heavy chain